MIRTTLQRIGTAIAFLLFGGVYVAAFLLRPFQMGRLLSSVSLPRMREHRLRTSLTTLGIALGVAVIVSVMIVNRSIVRGVTSTIDDVAGKADLQLGAGASGFSEELLDVVRDVPGVYKLTPTLQQVATLQAPNGKRERILLLGVDILGSDDEYFRDYDSDQLEQIREEPLSFLNSSTNVILSREVARRHGVKLHDKISLSSASGIQEFEVWGFVDGDGVGRAFGGSLGVMYYPAMQVAFGRGRNLDRIDIAVKPGSDGEPVARALEAKLGEGFNVDRPSLRGERVDKMLTAVQTALTMASIIALIAGAFLVFNTISIGIVQRKRELGILRALGITRKQLTGLLTLEGALLGIAGSAWGVLFGILLSRSMLRFTGDAVNRVYIEQATQNVEVDVGVIVAGVVLGVAASMMAAWLATQRAAGLRPVDALSSQGIRPAASRSGGLTRADVGGAALVLLSVGLLFLPPVGTLPLGALATAITGLLAGRALMPRLVQLMHAILRVFQARVLDVEATLASNNLPRDLSRTASTAAGLMAGGGLTLSFATFAVSFITSLNLWSAQTLPGDLFVTSGQAVSGLSGTNTPLSPAIADELKVIPGVERIRPIRFVDVGFRGSVVKIISTDIEAFMVRSKITPLEGTTDELKHGLLHGKVTISNNFSSLFNLHRGDTLTLPGKTGARTFEIAGVSVDYTSDRGTILMDTATFVEAFQDERVDTFELHLRPDAKPDEVREAINRKLGDSYDLFVLTNSEFRGELSAAISQIFELLDVLEVVTLIVALLGLLTALLANVLDRNRELGVLRAVGMLRAQVRKMVMLEATFVGMAGILGGIVLGLVLGYITLRHIVTVQLGWYLPFEFPVESIVQLVLITLPLSALAGYLPARRASNLIVTEALTHE